MRRPEPIWYEWIALMVILSAIVISVITTPGCVGEGQILAEDIQSVVVIVCDRHDAYVEADSLLTQTQSSIYLRSSLLLREIVQTAVEGD